MSKGVPIDKADCDDMVTKYIQISILSAFAKIFESLICPYIQSYLKLFLTESQHGFVHARSNCADLVTFIESLIEAVNARKQMDVIYTDLSKAFYKVSYKILLNKLEAYGLYGTILNCMSFISQISLFM